MYDASFAAVYDRLMADFDYPAWAAHYRALTGAKPGQSVVECACGTGSMAVELARAGLRVTGVDLSGEMLRLAQDKARAAGVQIPFIQQDMRALALHRPVDALICPCDGVNYLLDDASLRAFFVRAHRALAPGGAFAFDVSTPAKLRALADAPCYEDASDLTYFWLSRIDGPLVHMALTFFVRTGGGAYRRFDENQTQRLYPLEELTGALADAGFQSIRAYGDHTLEAAQPGNQRWHIAARRAP